jgi:hypothetical protein
MYGVRLAVGYETYFKFFLKVSQKTANTADKKTNPVTDRECGANQVLHKQTSTLKQKKYVGTGMGWEKMNN